MHQCGAQQLHGNPHLSFELTPDRAHDKASDAELADRNDTNSAITRIWHILGQLRRSSFTAEPGPASATGWQGHGTTQVSMRGRGADWLLVEQGRFWPAGAPDSLSLRNVYRWQRAGHRLRLYHERFGAKAAVFLFDLVATDQGNLVCKLPHLCGKDSYRGSIEMTDEGFDFNWFITGPRKDEHIVYRYRTR